MHVWCSSQSVSTPVIIHEAAASQGSPLASSMFAFLPQKNLSGCLSGITSLMAVFTPTPAAVDAGKNNSIWPHKFKKSVQTSSAQRVIQSVGNQSRLIYSRESQTHTMGTLSCLCPDREQILSTHGKQINAFLAGYLIEQYVSVKKVVHV